MDYESQHVHATSVNTNSYAMYAFNHFSKSRDGFRNVTKQMSVHLFRDGFLSKAAYQNENVLV